MKNTDRNYQTLDILKGIAMIMIIIVHNRHFILRDASGLRQLINFGQMGCQLFFLVSGFALCSSWNHLLEKHPVNSSLDWIRNYGRFMKRRYLRLAPGFLLILLANYLLNVLLIDILGLSPGFIMNREPAAVLTNILFLHGLFPSYINNVFPGGWYIGTTFLLYLLFPVLVSLYHAIYRHCPRSILIVPVLLWCGGFCLLRMLSGIGNPMLTSGNNSYLYFSVPNQLPCFCLGLTLYYQEKTDFSVKIPVPVSILLFLLTGIGAVYCYVRPEYTYIYFILPTLTGLAFYWLTVTMLHIEKSGMALSFPFLASCGRNSYGMYLIHAFFCWYGIKALTSALTAGNMIYPDLLLYCLLLPVTILCVYIAGLYLNRFLNFLDSIIRHEKRSS